MTGLMRRLKLMCGVKTTHNKLRQELRPASNIRWYDGQWVILVQSHEDGTHTVRYEDDRTNSLYRVKI